MPTIAAQAINNKQRSMPMLGGYSAGDTASAPGDRNTPEAREINAIETSAEESPDALLTGVDVALEMPENDDPTRRRIVNPTHSPRWLRMARNLFRRAEPTAEERAMQAEMQARKALEDAMRGDAETVQSRMINALNSLNLCYRYPKSQRDLMLGDLTGIQEVRFSEVLLMPDALYLRVAAPPPRGVSFLSLADPNTLTNLSISVQRQIYCKYNDAIGFWYIVPRAGSVMGIPGFVQYKEMMEKFLTNADKLTIPMGVTLNSRRVYKSITGMPHMLVAGATGTGKSNFGNILLATLIQRNAPDDLRMVLVDLKGGMEMSFYEGLPHLLPLVAKDKNGDEQTLTENGIIDNRNQVPDVLDWLIAEAERRMRLLKDAGYKDLAKHNARRKKGSKKLPRILLFIDEWADVKLAPGIGAKAEDKLANLAARSRAVGIHIVVCTQSPKREVIGTLIKTNLPGKVAFSMPSNTASILILDNGDAKGLAPAGRMIYQNANEQMVIQTPYMPDEMLRRIIAESIANHGAVQQISLDGRNVTAEEIMQYALDFLNGALPQEKIYAKFKDRIAKNELINWMIQWDKKEFEINGNIYIVKNENDRAGRRLFPISETTDTPV